HNIRKISGGYITTVAAFDPNEKWKTADTSFPGSPAGMIKSGTDFYISYGGILAKASDKTTYSRVAGVNSDITGYANGGGKSAKFNVLKDMTLLNKDTILIADHDNNMIRAVC